MQSQTRNTPGKRRGAGRPRRLTLEAIVDAACELDADTLDMASIATRLKVGVATLYGYVEGREHLLRLVAERKGQIEPIIDRGQSWQAILREHAASLYQIAMNWPQLVSQIMQGGVFGREEALYLEHLAALLGARGFSPGQVLDLYYGINQVVLGAAVTGTYLQAAQAAGGHDTLLRRYLMTHPGEELPRLRQALEQNPTPAVLGDYQQAVECLIEQCRPAHPPKESLE